MKVKLKEIGTIITGNTPKTSNQEYYCNPDFLFIGPSDLQNGKYIRKSEKYISEKAYFDYKTRFISKNDICVSCIGYIGYVAMATQSCLTNQQINSISRIDETVIIPDYLYYKLVAMKDYFNALSGNGSAVPIINKTFFENIEIDIHNLSDQQHIVDTVC